MTTVDIVAMPVSEKLKLMETPGDSLCVQSSGNMELPAWHGEALEERLRRLAGGEETVTSRKEAKERIRTQVRIPLRSRNACSVPDRRITSADFCGSPQPRHDRGPGRFDI